jgi:hypothetical protein
MTKDEYHQHPAQSYSKLKVLVDNPRKYYNKYIAKIESETSTKSKTLGTCLDLALTDYNAYLSLQVKDTKTTTLDGVITKTWKRQIDAWMQDLHNYLMALPEFQKKDGSYFTLLELFNKCTKQEIIFWDDEKTNEPMRGMLDFSYYHNGQCFWIDLKSTKAESFDEFMRDFEKYHYYLQVACYSTSLRIKYNLNYYPPAYYVAVSTATGEIWVIKCSDQMLTLGTMEMNCALNLLQRCRLTNEWSTNQPPKVAELSAWREDKILTLNQTLQGN